MADKRSDSTSQLIAEAEALRTNKDPSGKAPSTRTIVRDAERAIGRKAQGTVWMIALVAIAVLAVAAYLALG